MGQREVQGSGRVIVKMGGFSGCLSDEGQEGGEDLEREKVTDRPGTKMGVDAAHS